MIENATGLVLRVRPFSDTTLIVHWLTREQGRLGTIAKGALRPRSPFAGKLDLFYLAEFSFTRSRRAELHPLREVSLRDPRARLRHELTWLHQAAYAVALVEQTTETDTPVPGVFALLNGFLDHLPQAPPRARSVFAFELKLLTELGLQPDLAAARLTPATRALAHALAARDWRELAELQGSAAEVTALRRFLHGFLIYHLGKLPPGRAAALGQSSSAAH